MANYTRINFKWWKKDHEIELFYFRFIFSCLWWFIILWFCGHILYVSTQLKKCTTEWSHQPQSFLPDMCVCAYVRASANYCDCKWFSKSKSKWTNEVYTQIWKRSIFHLLWSSILINNNIFHLCVIFLQTPFQSVWCIDNILCAYIIEFYGAVYGLTL